MHHFEKRLSADQRLLCSAIQSHDGELSRCALQELRTRLGDQAAFDFAQRHEVACILGHHVQHSESDDDGLWVDEHRAVRERIAQYMQELDAVAHEFATHGIETVALKNGGIARGLYPCWGCCPMGDLDLLVRPRHFRRAHDLLVARGYQFEFRLSGLEANLEAAVRSGSTEYFRQLQDPEGRTHQLWIDFQSRPVSGLWIRPDQEPAADALIDRSLALAGTHVRVLAGEDNLLQVALHTAKHSYLRAPGLRLHTDVDRVLVSQSVDWDEFEQQVRKLSVCVPVYFSLCLARELLGTPVPQQILRSLRPVEWKERCIRGWIERAGLFEPQQRKFSRLGYMTFTALQYDDWRGLWRALFPESGWMRRQFDDHSSPLPLLHLRRLRKLIFRRLST